MRRPVLIVLLLVGIAATAYAGWACCRAGDGVLMGEGWTRPWPYPDVWLAALNDWFDAWYPVPRGAVKIEGEIARVKLTVHLALSMSLAVVACAALPLVWPWLRRLRRTRGFEVIAVDATERSIHRPVEKAD